MFEFIIDFFIQVGIFILIVSILASLIFIFGQSDKKDNITGR